MSFLTRIISIARIILLPTVRAYVCAGPKAVVYLACAVIRSWFQELKENNQTEFLAQADLKFGLIFNE